MPKQPHEISWDAETIAAFWNGLGTDASLKDAYFSRQRGRAVLRFVSRHLPPRGRVVDLGCGPGYLIDYLLEDGIACEGADLSPDSVRELNQRLQGAPLFGGARTFASPTDVPFPPAYADFVFCLETLEHLLDGDLDRYLSRVWRTLAPGGALAVTVPYRENLDRAKVTCGACGCRFHNTQHVRSFSEDSLRRLMEAHGFVTRVCKTVTLWPDPKVYLRSLRSMSRHYRLRCPECGADCRCEKPLLKNLLGKLRPSSLLHLVYVGTRLEEGADNSGEIAGTTGEG